MENGLVSIVILNWNGIGDTIECLDSIGKLTYPNIQAIVVDNGSKGDQAKQIADKFANVVVLPQKENLGFCGGCNVGIKYALDNGADYVMLLNNDALVTPDLVEKLIAGFEKTGNAGAVSPLILWYPDTENVWYARADWQPEKAVFTLGRVDDTYDALFGKEPYETLFACGCCLFTSAQIFREHGLLDERYFAFYEEAAWCAQLKREGLQSYVVPSAVVYHKGSRSTPSAVSGYLMTRNRLLWMKENLPFGERARSFRYLATDLLGNIANLLGITKKHQTNAFSRAVLLGYRDYFRGHFYKWSKATEKRIFD